MANLIEKYLYKIQKESFGDFAMDSPNNPVPMKRPEFLPDKKYKCDEEIEECDSCQTKMW